MHNNTITATTTRILLLVLVALGVVGEETRREMPTTAYTNSDFPLDPGRDFQCEVCQQLSRIVAPRLIDASQRGETAPGDLDLAVEEFLSPAVACHEGQWDAFEERSDLSSLEELLAACEAVVTAEEGELGEAVKDLAAAGGARATTADALAARIAAKWCLATTYCEGAADLWETSKDFPEAREKKLDRNKRMSIEFMSRIREDNRSNEVHFTDSGLGLRVLSAGSGPHPSDEDHVLVHYNATYINGMVVASSLEEDEAVPMQMHVANLIPGLREAFVATRKGGEAVAYIPPNLGYGKDQEGSGVGPGMALIFRYELLDILRAGEEDGGKDEL